MEENVETEIEKRVGLKVNELMKEVDQIITFLKALGEDVGLRLNKLFAQVDNIVVPLTNTVIKMEEAADHLTTFRESSQRVLESMAKLEAASKKATGDMDSFKLPELDVLGKQVNEVRNESYKALETVKLINEAARQAVETGVGTGAPAASADVSAIGGESRKALDTIRSVEELSRETSRQLAEIKEAGASALEAIRDVESRTRQVLQGVQGASAPQVREAAPPAPREPAMPKGGPPPPPSRATTTERETRATFAAAPQPPSAPAPARAAPTTHIYSSSAEQVFGPIEEALNSTAGALAKTILDVRDRIMGMTRKFGAIYDLASTARELARYPQRTLDRREKEVITEKLASWRAKLSDALTHS